MPIYKVGDKNIGSCVKLRWRRNLERQIPDVKTQMRIGANSFLSLIGSYDNVKRFSFYTSLNKNNGIDIRETKLRFFRGKNKETVSQEEFEHGIGINIASCLQKLQFIKQKHFD